LVRTARTDDRSATDYPSADPQAPRSFNQEPRVLKSISSPCLSVRGHVRTSRLLCAGALPFLRRAYEFLWALRRTTPFTRHSRVGDVASRRSCGRTDEEIAGFTSESGCSRH